MKKMILVIALLFVSLIKVDAAEVAKTCYYTDNASSTNIKIELYKGNVANCSAWITSFEGKKLNNKESCQNWNGEVRNTYYSNQECPYYTLVTYKSWSINSASVYVSYNERELQNIQEKLSNTSYILKSDNYDPEISNRKENCSDYLNHDECFYGVKDKNGNTCQWNISKGLCEKKKTCSEYLTEESCPEESHYGKCKWNSSNSKCEKYDIFVCKDYITKNTCPEYDEEGNACTWNDRNGCTAKNNDDGDGSGDVTEVPDPDYNVNNSATLANTCSSPSFRKPMKFVGIILNFVKIIIPIVIIAFGIIDLYKAVTANKDDGLKKAVKSIAIRVIAGVFIFLLPGIIQFILNMVNEWSDYKNVWCCCTDCILNPDCDTNSCSSESCHIGGTN